MSLDFLKETNEFKDFVQAVLQGEKELYTTGIIEQAKPYFLATFLRELKKRVIVIRPLSSPLSSFEEQVGFFLSQFTPLLKPSILPPLSENPYQEISPALESISTRMKFFHSLLQEPPHLLITNLLGLLKPFPHLQDLKQFFLNLENGEEFERDRLLDVLDGYGYVQEDLISSHGEYAWRGGIVDVFSPWQSFPYRIEFSGDEIASLREFDPHTQHSVTKIDRLLIPSLREHPSDSQFLEDWRKTAEREESASCWDDLTKKANLLQAKEFFPSFAFQSLLHKKHFVPFSHYFEDPIFLIDDFDEVEKDWKETIEDFQTQHSELVDQRKFCLPPEEIYPPSLWEKIMEKAICLSELGVPARKKSFHFPFQSVPAFENKIPFFLKYLKKIQEERERCFVYFSREGVRLKLSNLLSQHQIPHQESPTPFIFSKDGAVVLLLGNFERGFSYPKLKISYFSEKDIFTEERVLVSRPRVKPFLSHFQDLKADDYVVHTDYGIGIFKGLMKVEVDNQNREFMRIIYRDDDKLFVPVEDLNLVQKYAKMGTSAPILNKLGTTTWEKTKARTKKAIEHMAKELLELYAQRKAAQGYSFSAADAWQFDFEKMFEYEETEDQLRTIKEVTHDMESRSPMERLLCGDVGYGKTEVAIRASFKAVMDGKQVAILCPTTVLASQHLKTFRNRFVLFPVRIVNLTRLQSPTRQKNILRDLKKGLIDLVIGTHRLLSEDVHFKDLGLLVVDEEQRFGVRHKEKMKKMRTTVDVLTMTATPIPRTLNMSLTGLRDISLIETPPKDRLAIHTVVTSFNRKLIASAIKMELARGGQVYFIHNRIEDIDNMVQLIQNWVPQAKAVAIHGKMSSLELEKRMIGFIHQNYNVLVSTTIIENGIDIPLVNTLIVNRADRFGLAQLYQLRGRVGRSSRQAVAYFLVPPFTDLTSLAKERLKALQEFSELGSGFRLAAKDLEIRGAGNFLGAEQHGNMEAVGFDYYMQILEKTVSELRGEKTEEIKTEINLKVDIKIPEDYLPQINLRLSLYKRVSSIEDLKEIDIIRKEIVDRYGPLPSGVEKLFCYGAIKYLAHKMKIKAIDRIGQKIIFKFFPTSSADLSLLTEIIEKHSGSITPQGVMSLKLFSDEESKILDETISVLKELSLM